jgi:hypothetical protein
MAAKNSGDRPAFPRPGYYPDLDSAVAGVDYEAMHVTITRPQNGMSTRTYLAAQALKGLLASGISYDPGHAAEMAVRAADELLYALGGAR